MVERQPTPEIQQPKRYQTIHGTAWIEDAKPYNPAKPREPVRRYLHLDTAKILIDRAEYYVLLKLFEHQGEHVPEFDMWKSYTSDEYREPPKMSGIVSIINRKVRDGLARERINRENNRTLWQERFTLYPSLITRSKTEAAYMIDNPTTDETQ